jgi:hypothetical protein
MFLTCRSEALRNLEEDSRAWTGAGVAARGAARRAASGGGSIRSTAAREFYLTVSITPTPR